MTRQLLYCWFSKEFSTEEFLEFPWVANLAISLLSSLISLFIIYLTICAHGKGDYNDSMATTMKRIPYYYVVYRKVGRKSLVSSSLSAIDSYFVSQDVSPDVTDIILPLVFSLVDNVFSFVAHRACST